jgi:ribosome modulation factor
MDLARYYREGRIAHENGAAMDDCPYRYPNLTGIATMGRTPWLTGWLDANLQSKFPQLFRRGELVYETAS